MRDGGVAAGQIFESLKNLGLVTDADRGALDRYAQAHKDAADAVKKHQEELQKLADTFTGAAVAKEITDLATAVVKANPAGGITAAGLDALGKKLQELLGQGGNVIPVLDAMRASQISLGLVLPKAAEDWRKMAATLGQVAFLSEPIPAALGDIKFAVEGMNRELAKAPGVITLAKLQLDDLYLATHYASGATAELTKADREAITVLTQKTGSLDKALEILNKQGTLTDEQVAKVKAETAAQKDLSSALGQITQAFAQMAQVGGSSFEGLAKGIGITVSAINGSVKGFDAAKDALNAWNQEGGKTVGNAVAIAAGITSMIGAFYSLGLSIASAMNEDKVAHDFFVESNAAAKLFSGTLGEDLLKSIVATRDEIDRLTPALNGFKKTVNGIKIDEPFLVAAGAALHLTDIIKQEGGVSAKTLQEIYRSASTLFDVIKLGGKLGQDAITQLNGTIEQLGGYFEKAGGIWDKALLDLIQKSKDAGLNLQAVNDLIAGQQGKIGSGLDAVTKQIAAQSSTFDGLEKTLTDAQKAFDDLVSSGADQDRITKAGQDLLKAQDAVNAAAKTGQSEFDRLSRIALGAFNTLVASGKSPVDAMNQVGGSIDALIADAKSFGLAGNAAFTELARWRDLTKGNADLLSQIGGLNDLMAATANLGGLTADSFADLEAQGLSAYDKLLAAGFTQQEAEKELAPLLETILKLHDDQGLAIDANTQKLIDQARKDGELSKQQIDTKKVELDLLASIAKVLGADIPESFKKFAQAGTEAARQVGDAIDSTPKTVDIGVNYVPGAGLPPGAETFGGYKPALGGGAETYAMGGLVRAAKIPAQYFAAGGWPWIPKGTDTVPAMLTPGERVLSVAQNRAFERGGFGGKTTIVNVTIPVEALDSADVVGWLRRGGAKTIAREVVTHL